MAEEGELHVKSRFVAEDVPLSTKEIGSYMSRVGETTDLTVERLGLHQRDDVAGRERVVTVGLLVVRKRGV